MIERIFHPAGWIFLLLLWSIGCTNSSSSSSQPDGVSVGNDSTAAEKPITVTLQPGPQSDAVFETSKLPTQLLDAEQPDGLRRILAVYVGTNIGPDQPAMLGQYAVDGEVLRFTPAYPLEPGLSYTAIVSAVKDVSPRIVREFTIPQAEAGEPTVVMNVFPSTDQLPQNLLRFYLHFSAPMSQGDVYQYIRLINQKGEVVEDPFLEIGEELWDGGGTRLTLLFDPGRIKRGLKPNEDVGPPLQPGQDYELVISSDWPDATGRPLKAEFRRPFHVLPPDHSQPNAQLWTVHAPAANSTDALEITFGKSLDHGLLQRLIQITDESGNWLDGDFEIGERETHWRFVPASEWKPGRYTVVVETTLEDVVGNSLARPFEVKSDKQQDLSDDPTISIPFVVRPVEEKQ